MYCQICGQQRPVLPVSLEYNVGMIAMRRYGNINAHVCRTCGEGYFWEFNAINHAIGWWGLISFFATIKALVVNWRTFFKLRRLPLTPPTQQRCIQCGGFQATPTRRPALFASIIATVALALLIGSSLPRVLQNDNPIQGVLFVVVAIVIMISPAVVCLLKAFTQRKVKCVQCNHQWFV